MDRERFFRTLRNRVFELGNTDNQTAKSFVGHWERWSKEHPLYAKSLSFLDSRALGVVPMATHIADLDESIADYGFSRPSGMLLEKLNISVRWDNETPPWISHENVPVIAYGNHTTRFEHFALISQAQRTDIKFIAATWASLPGPNIQKCLYPVMRIPDKGSVFRFQGRSYDRSGAIDFNEASYHNAAMHLQDGGCLVIFPNATYPMRMERPWKGIGRILDALNDQTFREMQCAPLYFHSIRIRDILRNAHMAYTNKPTAPLEMHIASGKIFSGAVMVDDLQQESLSMPETPRHQLISAIMQRRYHADKAFSLIS